MNDNDKHAAPSRENDINVVLAELEKVTMFLEEEVEMHEQKLGRVLRQDPPETAKETIDAAKDRVPLANQIGMYANKIYRVAMRLQDIRNRLEL